MGPHDEGYGQVQISLQPLVDPVVTEEKKQNEADGDDEDPKRGLSYERWHFSLLTGSLRVGCAVPYFGRVSKMEVNCSSSSQC